MRHLYPGLLLLSSVIALGASRRSKGAAVDDEVIVIFLVAIAALAILIYVINSIRGASAKAAMKEKMEHARLEALRFFSDLEKRKKLHTVDVNIVLQRGEAGLLQEPSNLLETRAYRLYGGGGTRIRGVYIGGGASESYQRLRNIDSGTLVLTNRRLVFDGGAENRALNLKDILSVSCWSDAIEVSSSRRQKSQVYTVNNPFIWQQMIQMLASGKISLDETEVERGKAMDQGQNF